MWIYKKSLFARLLNRLFVELFNVLKCLTNNHASTVRDETINDSTNKL